MSSVNSRLIVDCYSTWPIGRAIVSLFRIFTLCFFFVSVCIQRWNRSFQIIVNFHMFDKQLNWPLMFREITMDNHRNGFSFSSSSFFLSVFFSESVRSLYFDVDQFSFSFFHFFSNIPPGWLSTILTMKVEEEFFFNLIIIESCTMYIVHARIVCKLCFKCKLTRQKQIISTEIIGIWCSQNIAEFNWNNNM